MLVLEYKIKARTTHQYQAIEEAIRTTQFVRNKCIRYWMDAPKESKINGFVLNKYSTELRNEFSFVLDLNSMAVQAAAERGWSAISRFYDNCKFKKSGKKGYPRFQKDNRSVEYKTSGWVRFVSSKNGEYKFKVYEEQEFNLSYRLNTTLDNLMTMRVQVPLHRRNG